MERKNIGLIIIYAICIILGLISVIMAYTGLPGTFDTEPLLAVGLLFVAIAGLISVKK